MSFTASCSYCCLAKLLERFGVFTSDRDIALEVKLPYRLRYREAEDGFYAGAMLQTPEDFNLFLRPRGLVFVEETVSGAAGYLDAHPFSMLGFPGERGRHAMVFLGREGERFRFFNPHREGDGQADELCLDPAALPLGKAVIGHMEEAPPQAVELASCLREAWEALPLYEAQVTAFCAAERTQEQLLSRRDALLRPIAVDLPAMAALAGEDALAGGLRTLQGQVFSLFRRENCIPREIVDMSLLSRVLENYRAAVCRELAALCACTGSSPDTDK